MFTKHFDSYVVDGDSIWCDLPDGFRARAKLYLDADSICPEDYPEPARTAWQNDEWHYYGVAVVVFKHGIQLTGDYDHALWGIEGNLAMDDGNSNPNAYFREVANDQLPCAVKHAEQTLVKLCEGV